MSQVIQLELQLWDTLNDATSAPLDADLQQLWVELDTVVAPLNTQEQLRVVADAITLIAQLVCDRSLLTFEELQAAFSDDGSVMAESAFDRYVRQSMEVDFEQFIEPLPSLPRKPPERHPHQLSDDGSSVAFPVDKEALIQALSEIEQTEDLDDEALKEQALAVAHDEDVSVWSQAISSVMQRYSYNRAVSLQRLEQILGMSLVEVWLGLLLSNQQYKWEQQGDFYSKAKDFWLSFKT